MSKMDALRAMREAKYAANATTRAPQPTGSAPARAAKAVTASGPSAKPAAPPAVPVDGDEGLCGHRNMSGRTCTREQGHAAKSHRYS
jgi:hypothetical protein